MSVSLRRKFVTGEVNGFYSLQNVFVVQKGPYGWAGSSVAESS
jgi:hypothetical protein